MKSLRFRTTIKLTFALLAVWLGLVWAGLPPRPAFLPPELNIEPLTYILSAVAAMLFIFWKNPTAQSDGRLSVTRSLLPTIPSTSKSGNTSKASTNTASAKNSPGASR
jgi:hypothetical protein